MIPSVVLGTRIGDPISQGFSYGGTLYYEGSNTFAKADYPGLRAILVEGLGGGGGGGGTVSTNAMGAAGGCSGAYFRKLIMAVDLSDSETITVGAAGAGGVADTGATGGTSSFGAHATAEGGLGGVGGSTTTPNARTNAQEATATGGDLNINGGLGAGGQAAADSPRIAGYGAAAPLGFGTGGPNVRFSLGNNAGRGAAGYGAGGGASSTSSTNQSGGAGAPGLVIVHLLY